MKTDKMVYYIILFTQGSKTNKAQSDRNLTSGAGISGELITGGQERTSVAMNCLSSRLRLSLHGSIH